MKDEDVNVIPDFWDSEYYKNPFEGDSVLGEYYDKACSILDLGLSIESGDHDGGLEYLSVSYLTPPQCAVAYACEHYGRYQQYRMRAKVKPAVGE